MPLLLSITLKVSHATHIIGCRFRIRHENSPLDEQFAATISLLNTEACSKVEITKLNGDTKL